MTQHEWRPIDTAPKDGTIILVAGGQDDNAHYSAAVPDGAIWFMLGVLLCSFLIGMALGWLVTR